MDDRIIIEYDGGDTASEIKKIEKAFKDQAEGLDRVTVKAIEYNRNMAVLGATVEALDVGGNKLIFQLQQQGEVLETLNRKLIVNTKATDEASKSEERLRAAKEKRASAEKTLADTSKIVGINKTLPDATPGEVLAFQRAKDEYLRSLLAKGVGPSNITDAAKRIKGGEDPFALTGTGRDIGPDRQNQIRSINALLQYQQAYENLGRTARSQTDELTKSNEKEIANNERKAAILRKSLQDQTAARIKEGETEEANRVKTIVSIQQQLAKEDALRRAQGERNQARFLREQEQAQNVVRKIIQQQERFAQRGAAETQLRNMFPAPPTATISQLNLYERNIQRILGLVEKGKVDLATFNRLLSSGGSAGGGGGNGPLGPAGFGGSGDEAKIISSLNNLRNAFNLTGEAGVGSARGILLSWQSIVRLFEVQVFHQALTRLVVEFQTAITRAQEYSIKIAEIETIQGSTKLSTEEWAASLDKLSGKYGFQQLDVAAAAYETLSNNVGKGKDAIQFLDTSLEFARVTNSTAKESVDLLSSAINSFGLQSKQAKDVAEIFFKSIENGRIRTSQVAEIFGRVGVSANLLGVKFEELNAAITTLSVKGIRPAEVFTLLNNVFTKLTKPTEAMQTLFDKWGVSSGEAAVQTFGFAEVLRKLGKEAQDGNVKISELFNEIRSFRGGSGLLASLSDFEKNLAAPSNYNEAVLTTQQKNVMYLRTELEKLSISFTNVGHSINEFIIPLSKNLGGLDNGVRGLFSSLGTTAKAAILFGVALKTVSLTETIAAYATTTLSTQLAVYGTRATVSAVATNLLQGAMATLASPAGIAAVITGLVLLVDYLRHAEERATAAREALKNLLEEQTLERLKDLGKFGPSHDIEGEIDQLAQRELKNIAFIRAAAQDLFGIFKKAQGEAFEDLKLTSSSFLDALQDSVNKTKERLREIESEIKRSVKTVDDLNRRYKNDLFEIDLQSKLQAVKNGLASHHTLIENYYKDVLKTTKKGETDTLKYGIKVHRDSGADADAKEQNKREAEGLEIHLRLQHAIDDLEEARVNRNKVLKDSNGPDKEKLNDVRQAYADIYAQLKAVAQLEAKVESGTGQHIIHVGDATNRFAGGLGQAVGFMEKLTKEAQSLEAEYQKALKADEERQKKKLEEEQKRLRLAKDIIKELLELESIGSPDSKVQDKFKTDKDPTGSVGALKHLRDLSKELIDLSGKSNIGFEKQIELFNSLQEAFSRAKASVVAGGGGDLANLDKAEKKINQLTEAIKKQRTESDAARDVFARAAEDIKNKAAVLAEELVHKGTGIGKYPLGGLTESLANPQIQQYHKDLVHLQEDIQGLGVGTSKEKIQEVLNNLKELQERNAKLYAPETGRSKNEEDLKRLSVIYSDLKTKLEELLHPAQQFNAESAKLGQMEKQLIDALNAPKEVNLNGVVVNLNAMNVAGIDAAKNIKTGFDSLVPTMKEVNTLLDTMNFKLDQIKSKQNIKDLKDRFGGGKKDVGFAPDDFNPQVKPLLQGPDSGDGSKLVSNNPSINMNILIEPKSLSQDDVRELGARLRREIQRGTVNLNS